MGNNIKFKNGLLVASIDSISGPGVISLTSFHTDITTTGADAYTLADGEEGQIKSITMIVKVGNGVLTPANLLVSNTITFDTAGDAVILLFSNGNWEIISNFGCALA